MTKGASPRMALTAPALYSRVRTLLPEMIKFLVVGGLGAVIDLGGAGLLQGVYHVEPLAAKAVSVSLATVFTYLGSRFWTFKERENQTVRREAVLFFLLNVIGLLIAEAVIGLMIYAMGLHGRFAYNAASFIGTGLGTIFRFWAYRKWVFLDPGQPSAAPTLLPGVPAFPDYEPWEFGPSFLAPAEVAAAQAPVAASVPVPAPTYSAPWHQAQPASAWDPALAPTMSWPVAAPQAAPVPEPAPVAAYDFYAPDRAASASPVPASVPTREMRRTSPAAIRSPRSSRGGRHRKR